MIQRRGARFVQQKYDMRTSVTSLLQDLQWAPLVQRRWELRLALLYKIINGKVAIPLEDILIRADQRRSVPEGTTLKRTDTYTHSQRQYRQSFFPTNGTWTEPATRVSSYLRIPPAPFWLGLGLCPKSVVAPPPPPWALDCSLFIQIQIPAVIDYSHLVTYSIIAHSDHPFSHYILYWKRFSLEFYLSYLNNVNEYRGNDTFNNADLQKRSW